MPPIEILPDAPSQAIPEMSPVQDEAYSRRDFNLKTHIRAEQTADVLEFRPLGNEIIRDNEITNTITRKDGRKITTTTVDGELVAVSFGAGDVLTKKPDGKTWSSKNRSMSDKRGTPEITSITVAKDGSFSVEFSDLSQAGQKIRITNSSDGIETTAIIGKDGKKIKESVHKPE